MRSRRTAARAGRALSEAAADPDAPLKEEMFSALRYEFGGHQEEAAAPKAGA